MRGILVELAERPALTQQVPALIERDLYASKPGGRAIVQIATLVERFLFRDERFDSLQNGFVGRLLSHVIYPRAGGLQDRGTFVAPHVVVLAVRSVPAPGTESLRG
jgi:hypothetical protein